jgi:hypothetical protein
MEQFFYLQEQKILICKLCAYAILPTYLYAHLKGHRNQLLGLEGARDILNLEYKLREFPLCN